MVCLHCGKKLSMVKKLTTGEFCSAAHKKDYLVDQEKAALARLIENQVQLSSGGAARLRKQKQEEAAKPKATKRSERDVPADDGLAQPFSYTPSQLRAQPGSVSLLLTQVKTQVIIAAVLPTGDTLPTAESWLGAFAGGPAAPIEQPLVYPRSVTSGASVEDELRALSVSQEQFPALDNRLNPPPLTKPDLTAYGAIDSTRMMPVPARQTGALSSHREFPYSPPAIQVTAAKLEIDGDWHDAALNALEWDLLIDALADRKVESLLLGTAARQPVRAPASSSALEPCGAKRFSFSRLPSHQSQILATLFPRHAESLDVAFALPSTRRPSRAAKAWSELPIFVVSRCPEQASGKWLPAVGLSTRASLLSLAIKASAPSGARSFGAALATPPPLWRNPRSAPPPPTPVRNLPGGDPVIHPPVRPRHPRGFKLTAAPPQTPTRQGAELPGSATRSRSENRNDRALGRPYPLAAPSPAPPPGALALASRTVMPPKPRIVAAKRLASASTGQLRGTRLFPLSLPQREVNIAAPYFQAHDEVPARERAALLPLLKHSVRPAKEDFSPFSALSQLTGGGRDFSWNGMKQQWRQVPSDLRLIALAVPLVIGLIWFSTSPQSREFAKTDVRAMAPDAKGFLSRLVADDSMVEVKRSIQRRAAVELSDDFRQGLGEWSGVGDWARGWSYDPSGFLRPRQLAFYSPTLELSDYRFEFLGLIERKALSWVFRAADPKNYYVNRLEIVEPSPLPEVELIRYAVINGKAGPKKAMRLPMQVQMDTLYRVRVDVSGPNFVTTVQGQIVDVFSDDRIARGGVGFFAGSGEEARLRWVEVSHQYDFLGRLCAFLVPYNVSTTNMRSGQ